MALKYTTRGAGESVVSKVRKYTRGSLYGKKMMLSKTTAAGRKRRKKVADYARVNRSGFRNRQRVG